MLLSALVAACGQLPRPFQPDSKADTVPLLFLADGFGVVVRPVADLPPPAAAALAKAVVEELGRAEVPATTGEGNRASYILNGRAAPRAGGGVLLAFSLDDPLAAAGSIYRTKAEIPFLPGADDAAAWRQIARPIAAAVAATLQPPAPQPPVARRRVIVREITGAPADDRRALARALEYNLRRAQVPVADEPADDTLAIVGALTIARKGPDSYSIGVLWTVLGPDGAEIGQVRQDNDVPARMLDRAWPEIAAAVAEGAAEGIADLVNRAPRPS
ncbi:MAG: hypothetical protein HY057_11885 [Rhodospirillales bacterium]|nr:hypothetical protein [Rhodospirillales bacterium]